LTDGFRCQTSQGTFWNFAEAAPFAFFSGAFGIGSEALKAALARSYQP
jgi:hypothetical protein